VLPLVDLSLAFCRGAADAAARVHYSDRSDGLLAVGWARTAGRTCAADWGLDP